MRTIIAMSIAAALALFAATGCGDGSCKDGDGDGFFGKTADCPSGRDCDDSRAAVSPDEDEICTNGRDDNCNGAVDECGDGPTGDAAVDGDAGASEEDGGGGGGDTGGSERDGALCDGTDAACGTVCVDSDGDGWGVAGQNAACPESGADCDDSDPEVHPGATETCNSKDDDCDGDTDECSTQGASCKKVGGTKKCVTSVGGTCSSSDVCPEHTKCDGGVSPSECRKIRGESCTGGGQCRSSLSCSDGRCSGSHCSMNSCGGDRPICDDDTKSCVECRYWYPDPPGSLSDCGSSEVCLGKGACGGTTKIDDASPVSPPYPTATQAMLDVARALAECWGKLKGGDPEMCLGFETTGALPDAVTEKEIRNTYQELKNAKGNNNLQKFSDKNFQRLKDLVGDGLANTDDLAWKKDIPPNSSLEICAWYHDHGLLGRDRLHVDDCDNFSW